MTLLKATAHQGQNEISFYATKKRFNNISSIDINGMPGIKGIIGKLFI